MKPLKLEEEIPQEINGTVTVETDSTVTDCYWCQDQEKYTFTYQDHNGSEKPPYPKYTIICYGKETMLNIMERFDGYSYSIT